METTERSVILTVLMKLVVDADHWNRLLSASRGTGVNQSDGY